MSDLPGGWEWTTLGEITSPRKDRLIPSPEDEQPYLSLEDVAPQSTRVLGWRRARDYRSTSARISPGDVLYGRLRPYLNKVTVADREALASSEFIVLQRSPAVSPKWLMYRLNSPDFVCFADQISDGDRPRVKWSQMSKFRFGLPPLQEQERIFTAIEEHLSRLDAADRSVQPTRAKLARLRTTTIWEVLTRRAWPLAVWGDVGHTLSGRAFPSAFYTDSGIRLLRPGNLSQSGSVTWTAKTTTHLPESYAERFPKYVLRGRNLLMNLTAQSLADDFLGRVCLSGDDDGFLLNQRIAKLSSPLAHDDYLFWVFRSASFRRFVAGLNTGSLIQHISTRQLASFEFPLPSIRDQRALVNEIESTVEAIDRTELELDGIPNRSSLLRRSVLSAALSGKLVAPDPTDEPASLSLDRIRAARATAGPAKRARKARTS